MISSGRLGALNKLTIAKRIVLLFLVNISITAIISAVSVFYFSVIAQEIEQVAHEDIPLTRHITLISTLQLEQAIHLERAVRYGELMSIGYDTQNKFSKEVGYFNKLDVNVEKELGTTLALLDGFLAIDHQPEALNEFMQVKERLTQLDRLHAEFSALARKTIARLDERQLDEALKHTDKLVEIEDRADNLIIELLHSFEKFTEKSLLAIEAHEKNALRNVIWLIVIATLVASVISYTIIKSIAGPLKRIKEFLVALGHGANIEVPHLKPGTEIGDIYNSLSLIGNNFAAINRTQGCVFIACNGEIEFSNSLFASFISSTPEQLTGKSIDTLIPAIKTTEKQWQQLHTGKPVSGEYQVSINAGREIWINATFNPILDLNNTVTRIILFATDITEDVKQREEVAMLSLVAAKTDNLVVITDANECIEYVNDGFLRLTGYSRDECIGKLPGPLLQGPDTSEETKKQIKRKLQAKQPFYDEILNYTKSGEPYWISMAINPVFDDSGNLVRFVSIQGEVTKNKLISLENERGMQDSVNVLTKMSKGDLTQRMSDDYDGTFDQISSAINETMHKLVEVVAGIRQVADRVDSAADEMYQGNVDISRRTEHAAASLEETSSSMQDLKTQVQQNSESSSQAKQLATLAYNEAERGGSIVGQAVDAMRDINDSSQKISDIIGVIDDIAFQTNLLALNASVEAARAGEQGRGFAVVASEVRNLAGRSAVAAKEIAELIESSARRVEHGVKLVNDSGETLESIVKNVKQVADFINEIVDSSNEQSAGIASIYAAVAQLDEATQKNSALVEQSASVSQSTRDQAQQLVQLLSFFNVSKLNEMTTTVAANEHTNEEQRQLAG